MGVCDSSSNKNDSMSTLDSSKKSRDFNKIILKNNDGFILSSNISKRDNINKHYNIQQKILGEGASGVVCIGEKNGVQYAIKKIRKNKITSFKPFIS